ncbi:MAG: DMT family transporter [Methylacidiphilales bacterium]|nr:DMT family transporter [Candidatus Methylacidiphilales bacterium]
MRRNNPPPVVPLVRRARFLLIGATVLWGLSFPLMRGLELAQRANAPAVSDSTLACADMAVRFGLAALCFLPFLIRQLGGITFREWSQALGLAFLAGPGLYLQTLGLAWTDASVSAFLTQMYTLLVPLVVALRDRRFPSPRVIFACFLVLVGISFLSPGFFTHFLLGPGEIVILLSTLFFACQIVWVERPLYAENRTGLVTFLMFTLIAAQFLLVYGFTGGGIHAASELFGAPALWQLTLALVFLCTVFNFFIMNTWQRCVSATEAGLIYCIEPVIASVLCGFLPGWISRLAAIGYADETLHWTLFVGGVLIIIATVLVATEPRGKS